VPFVVQYPEQCFVVCQYLVYQLPVLIFFDGLFPAGTFTAEQEETEVSQTSSAKTLAVPFLSGEIIAKAVNINKAKNN
jgi:hypothetical protein